MQISRNCIYDRAAMDGFSPEARGGSPCGGPPGASGDGGAIALRGGAVVRAIRAEGPGRLRLPRSGGSYLCSVIAGELAQGDGAFGLVGGRLCVLRGTDPTDEAGELRWRGPTLAVVIYFPADWCASCPRAPTCRIGRFLLRGGGAATEPETAELDDAGMRHSQALLRCAGDTELDILSIEQAMLGLLACAYRRCCPAPCEAPRAAGLPARAAVKVRQAADILRRRIDQPPTIAELARLVGMNECDLKRCFKCLHGASIAAFSRERRLEAARALLEHGTLPIAAIALEIGFSNPSQFARAFRKRFGANPVDHRRGTGG
jgi:AraC-like DNA-binding protein